ncbi:MAG: hypothetical protein AUJ47_09550 [Candidatus Marinimicrobia bacterium CG1_02_48_14]|nr:MAG: hypothetical protein AUJ47_09550 [Candidatus Marinimicrobia bacterium CG1_02_48_14]
MSPMLRQVTLLIFGLTLIVQAQNKSWDDCQSWSEHYPNYLRQSAAYWVTNRTSQVILGSWLVALPILIQTDSQTSESFQDAALLGADAMLFGEAWGRIYAPLTLVSLTALETWAKPYASSQKYQRLEYVVTTYGTVGVLIQSLKTLTHRLRPDHTTNNSFPSGHTSVAFSTAEITRQLYGNGWGGAAYGLALVTAVQRVQSDRHWLGDVVSGAVLSMTIARALAPGKTEAGTFDIGVSSLPQFDAPLLAISVHLPTVKP